MVTQEDIEAVWPACVVAARTVAKRLRMSKYTDDAVGAAAVRVCEAAKRYNPKAGASWRTWAIMQAYYAAQDAMLHVYGGSIAGMTRRGEELPTIRSADGRVMLYCLSIDERADPVGWEMEYADMVERFAVMAGRCGWVLREKYLRGRTIESISRDLGVTPSAVSKVYVEAIGTLRGILTGGAEC